MRRADPETPARQLAEYLGKLYNYLKGPGHAPCCEVDEEKLMRDVMICLHGQTRNPPPFLRPIQEILQGVDPGFGVAMVGRSDRPRKPKEVLREILICVAHHWGLSQRKAA